MGNNQSSRNPMLADWKEHPIYNHIFVDQNTKQEVQRYTVSLEPTQQVLLQKRIGQHHQYIAKIRYYHPVEVGQNRQNKQERQQLKYQVYTDRVLQILPQEKPVNFALNLLKGYRRLCSNWGFMRVCSSMVGVNEKNQLKIWINPNISANWVWKRANNEKETLIDLCKIIEQYDLQDALSIKQANSMNEAISILLANLSQDKIQITSTRSLYPSNTSVKNITRNLGNTFKEEANIKKNGLQEREKQLKQSKNLIRSTKETNQDGSKIPKYIEMYMQKKNNLKSFQKEGSQNLKNSKSSNYITNFRGASDHRINESSSKSKNQHHSEILSQKETSGYQNSSQPSSEALNMKRKYRPIEHKPQVDRRNIQIPNSNSFLTHYLSPKGNQPRKQGVGEHFNAFKDSYQYLGYFNRNSDLNREVLQKNWDSRPSDIHTNIKSKQINSALFESKGNQNRKEQSSKSRPKPGSKQTIQEKPNFIYDTTRNRTQDFGSYMRSPENSSFQNNIYSPRSKTRQFNELKKSQLLQEYKSSRNPSTLKDLQSKKDEILSSKSGGVAEKTKNKFLIKNEEQFVEKKKIDNISYEQKKTMKQMLAKTLREELGGVLDPSLIKQPTRQPENIKNAKDLVIQRRVEEKKRNFAQLKSQAQKLLNN